MFQPLNFPPAELRISGNKVWDVLQKKLVLLTPEEWVRQHTIHYLINVKGYSKNLMQSEYTVKYNSLRKRCDIVVFNNKLKPILIVECKAPQIKLTENTFFQIAKYYSTLQAPILMLTNGLHHVYAMMNDANADIQFLEDLPSKAELDLKR